jgi:hypothetical protein
VASVTAVESIAVRSVCGSVVVVDFYQ